MQFNIRHDVYFHQVPPQPDTTVLAAISELKGTIMSKLDDLGVQISGLRAASDLAVEFIGKLDTKLDELAALVAEQGADQAKIEQWTNEVRQDKQELLDKITSTTIPGEVVEPPADPVDPVEPT